MKNKTEAELAIESLMNAMKSYENNSNAQEEEATKIAESLSIDREKILEVLKKAVKKD